MRQWGGLRGMEYLEKFKWIKVQLIVTSPKWSWQWFLLSSKEQPYKYNMVSFFLSVATILKGTNWWKIEFWWMNALRGYCYVFRIWKYLYHINEEKSHSKCHFSHSGTGCSLNIVFYSEFFKIFRTLFSLGVSMCTHTRQVEHQRCSRTGRIQKNHNILRKKHNI